MKSSVLLLVVMPGCGPICCGKYSNLPFVAYDGLIFPQDI
jgi:hypothetical protein